jgi:hypothetical protein
MAKSQKLGNPNLTDSEKEAIAEMVESAGFKAWLNKVIPARMVQLSATALASPDYNTLLRIQGQAAEIDNQPKKLMEIATEYNAAPDQED